MCGVLVAFAFQASRQNATNEVMGLLVHSGAYLKTFERKAELGMRPQGRYFASVKFELWTSHTLLGILSTRRPSTNRIMILSFYILPINMVWAK